MKKKWIVIPSLLVLALLVVLTLPVLKHFWNEYKPRPTVVVDGAMRSEAIEMLVATLNGRYIFPDKAKQMELVLRQHRLRAEQAGRERHGRSDRRVGRRPASERSHHGPHPRQPAHFPRPSSRY